MLYPPRSRLQTLPKGCVIDDAPNESVSPKSRRLNAATSHSTRPSATNRLTYAGQKEGGVCASSARLPAWRAWSPVADHVCPILGALATMTCWAAGMPFLGSGFTPSALDPEPGQSAVTSKGYFVEQHQEDLAPAVWLMMPLHCVSWRPTDPAVSRPRNVWLSLILPCMADRWCQERAASTYDERP